MNIKVNIKELLAVIESRSPKVREPWLCEMDSAIRSQWPDSHEIANDNVDVAALRAWADYKANHPAFKALVAQARIEAALTEQANKRK